MGDILKTLKMDLEENIDSNKIKKLVESLDFWFGDSNLPYDKYFKKFLEKDGWVPIKNFFNFNKVKEMEITEPKYFIEAAKLSKGFLELNKTNDSIRRIKPLPTKEDMEKRLERTFYYKITKNPKNNRNDGIIEFSTSEEAKKAKKSLK